MLATRGLGRMDTFDLTGEPNPKYDEIIIRGTDRLLDALESLEVEQFVFAGTMLVHRAGRPGKRIDEQRPLDPKLPSTAAAHRREDILTSRPGALMMAQRRSGQKRSRGPLRL